MAGYSAAEQADRRPMGMQAIGEPVRREEDPRLLTGGGRYVDDFREANEARGYVLRSPHAHARIAAIGRHDRGGIGARCRRCVGREPRQRGTFKQVLSEKLGIDADLIRYRYGDSDLVTMGIGTFGSRSAQLAGSAVVVAADRLIDKGRRIAAHTLEAAVDDIVFDRGRFAIAGTDRSVGIAEVESGQLISGSFQDYCMPRADDFCGFVLAGNPTPTAKNPLGVKGVGEAGTLGAIPAVMNAVNDALAAVGAPAVAAPATPEKLWRALRAAPGAAA